MDSTEQTFEGKLLPRHLKMFRDMDSGRIELRYWKFEPILLFLIPFMSVWSGGRTRRFDLRIDTEITDSRLEKKPNIQIHMPTANNPFVRKISIKNGYRS